MHRLLLSSVLFAVASVSASVIAKRHDLHREVAHRTRSSKVPVITTCSKSGSVAIAFDDGPYKWDDNLTATLDKNDIKGTFFLNGNNWDCIYNYVPSIRKRFNEGHMIQSHTWSHDDLTTLNETDLNLQFQLIEEAFVKILGVKPLYFRPPYGSYNDMVLEVAYQRGYKGAITWNYDSGDSSTPATPAKTMIANYKSHFAGGPKGSVKTSITLNHDVKSPTVHKVIPTVVPYLKQKGYSLETVGACLDIPASDWYVQVGKPGTKDSSWTCAGTPGPGEP